MYTQAVIGQRQLFFCSVIQSVLFWLAKTKSTFSKAFYF